VQNHFTAFRTLSVAKDYDGMIIAEYAYALLRRRITLSGSHAEPVEDGRDVAVRQQTREITNRLFGRCIGFH
jgi:hypothetical protein